MKEIVGLDAARARRFKKVFSATVGLTLVVSINRWASSVTVIGYLDLTGHVHQCYAGNEGLHGQPQCLKNVRTAGFPLDPGNCKSPTEGAFAPFSGTSSKLADVGKLHGSQEASSCLKVMVGTSSDVLESRMRWTRRDVVKPMVAKIVLSPSINAGDLAKVSPEKD